MSAKHSWYAISNSADNTAQIEITEEIGYYGISAAQFIKDLRPLAGKKIELLINSPGGSIVDGQAIISALKRHTGGVVAYVYGLAASMASVIACAADQCFMAEGSLMMVHRASTVSMGDADDLRKDASLLEKFEKGILAIYSKKTGMEFAEIEKMLAEETWMDALEAVALGFADGITENTPAMAIISPEAMRQKFDIMLANMAKKPKAEAEATEVPVVETPAVEETPVTEPAPLVTEPAVEPAPEPAPAPEQEAPAPVEAPAVEEPAPEPIALAAKATAILDKYNDLVAERDSFKAQNAILKTSLAATEETLARLETSLGLSAAVVVPPVGAGSDAAPSLVEQFTAITDPAERNAFYRKNAAALKKLI